MFAAESAERHVMDSRSNERWTSNRETDGAIESNVEHDEAKSQGNDNQVCPVCSSLTASYKLIDPSALTTSARSKRCVGCMLTLDALEKMDVDVASLNYDEDALFPPDPILFVVNDDDACRITAGELDIEIYASERESKPYFNHLTHGTDVSGNTGSPETIACVKQWMQECTAKHWNNVVCPPNLDVPLPHRVLEIDMLRPLDKSSVRLIKSNGKNGTYACLTHCWGVSPPLQTLRRNYWKHKRGIQYSKLPKTFREAVKVARELGIPYLWIDSLCIIQNNDDDWTQQSALMANIYQNGRLTIVAANSKDSTGGCFVDTSRFISKELVAIDDSGKKYYARARCVVEHGGWPTLQRAWVYQERLLSPRILHFGHAEVVWECFEQLTCECSRAPVAAFHRYDFMLGKKNFIDQWVVSPRFMFHFSEMPIYWWVDKWRDIVATYSRLSLTYRKDIFVALSGAVKQMQQHRRSRYFAGMWEDSLIEDLLWDGADPQQPRPLAWHSPTWSWGIVSGDAYRSAGYVTGASYMSIRLWGVVQTTFASIADSSRTHLWTNAPDQDKPAQLTLNGPSIAARLEQDGYLNKIVFLDFNSDGLDERCSLKFSADYNLSAAGHGRVVENTLLICLKMAFVCRENTDQSEIEEERGKGEMVYLVLRERPNKTSVYERIGMLNHLVVGSNPYEHLEVNTSVTIV